MLSDKQLLIDQLEATVEQHITTAVTHFQSLSEEILLKPRNDGGWSIAQCLEHLNSYGRYYLPAIEQGLKTQTESYISASFKSSWFGRYFTSLMDPVRGRIKFKAFKAHTPNRDVNAYGVVAEFIQQQETLLNYLEDARNIDLNIIHIPISILKILKLNLGDVFQFLIAHNERHVLQAQRNID